MSGGDSSERAIARRAACLGMLAPVAAIAAGCASAPRQRPEAQTERPEVRGGLGAFAMSPQGTRVFRDHELVDQDGRRVRFQSDLVEERVFAATFMYVQCKGICTDMTARMRDAHRLLEPVMGEPVRFYTFSLAEDSPAEMKAAMRARGIDRLRGWSMLTAPREVVRDIRWAFGFFEPDEELDLRLDGHTGMARFGNHASDKWSACPALGSGESIARGVLGVLAHEDRERVRWFAEEHNRNGRPIPGWTNGTRAG